MTAGESASDLHSMRLGGNLLGFYDGRGPAAASAPIDNWVDDGALSLGICSFAIVDGPEAIVYDTHVSIAHARRIREAVEQLGARSIRVVLSHWHLDHIAGTEAFADCEIIANGTTAALMAEHRSAIEAGTHEGPPAISPLILPTTVFDDRLRLELPQLRRSSSSSSTSTAATPPSCTCRTPGSCSPVTPSRTLSPTSASPIGSRRTSASSSGCGAWTRARSSRTTAAARSSRAGDTRETLIDATQRYVRNLLGTASEPCRAARRPAGVRQRRARGRLDLLVRAVRARPPEQPRGRSVRLTGAALSRARACP